MVTTNLIDAYEQLNGFIAKHTLDRFHLVDGQSVSLRSIISRELVSNILVHRDYGSAYPAKIIIERDRIVMENWALPKRPGRIDPNDFMPFPKNPILARFFINIGRADVLGSGVRNLYEYTKRYSGGEPELIEGDVFKTTVPLSKPNSHASDKSFASDKVSDKVSDKSLASDNMSDKASDSARKQMILSYIETHGEINAKTAATLINRSSSTARRILSQLVDESVIVAFGANRNRKYKK